MIKSKLVNFLTNYSRNKKFSSIKKLLLKNRHSVILDIACGRGDFLEKFLSEDCEYNYSLDNLIAIDFRIDHLVNLNKKFKSCKLVVADACNLPFKDKRISLVVSDALLEHISVEKREKFAFEVNRVAQNYWISTPNRFSLFEVHYYLPFIGWMKTNFRDKIIRILGRKLHYDPINLLNYNELKNLFCDYTEFHRLNIFKLFEHLIIIKNSEEN